MFLPESGFRTETELARIRQMFGYIGREPHPGQMEFFRYHARYRVLLNGRRWGKTHLLAMAIMVHIQEMHQMEHPSPRVRLIAPENKQIQETLNYLKLLCNKLGLPIREYTNPRDWHLVAGRVRIEPRSGRNRETHRGAGITFAVIDECSEIPGDLFHYAIRPSLTDYRGHVLMAGTPKGRNWVIEWAESEGIQVPYGWTDEVHVLLNPTSNFLLMRAPTWQNIYLPADELATIRSQFYALRNRSERDLDRNQLAILQEYGAVILVGYQRPFPVEPIYVTEWTQEDLYQMRYADWVIGLDYGFTAPSACVLAAYCPDGQFRVPVVGYEVKIDDHEYVDWVADHLRYKIGQSPVQQIIADPAFWTNSGHNRGVSLAQLLERLGIPLVKGIRERSARWQHLRMVLSDQRVIIYKPNAEGLIEEFSKVRPADNYGAKQDIKKPDHALTALAHATEYYLSHDPPAASDPFQPEANLSHEIHQFLSKVYEPARERSVRRNPRGQATLEKARWN